MSTKPVDVGDADLVPLVLLVDDHDVDSADNPFIVQGENAGNDSCTGGLVSLHDDRILWFHVIDELLELLELEVGFVDLASRGVPAVVGDVIDLVAWECPFAHVQVSRQFEVDVLNALSDALKDQFIDCLGRDLLFHDLRKHDMAGDVDGFNSWVLGRGEAQQQQKC